MKKDVYLLICPICKKLKYVGSSENAYYRLKQHMFKNNTLKLWINYLKDNGYVRPKLEFVISGVDSEEALIIEQAFITKYKQTIFNKKNSYHRDITRDDLNEFQKSLFDNKVEYLKALEKTNGNF
jgi:predicted GIY-YIG superfamily endonuclease